MDVHAHDDFRGVELLEGIFDAVGDIGGYPDLRLHLHIGGAGHFDQVVEQCAALFLVGRAVLVVVYHIECHETPVQFGVTHHDGHADQSFCHIGIFHRQQYFLIVCLGLFDVLCLVGDDELAGAALRHEGADDAGEENHDDHAVEHVVVDHRMSRRHLQAHAHHHHGDTAGGMG